MADSDHQTEHHAHDSLTSGNTLAGRVFGSQPASTGPQLVSCPLPAAPPQVAATDSSGLANTGLTAATHVTNNASFGPKPSAQRLTLPQLARKEVVENTVAEKEVQHTQATDSEKGITHGDNLPILQVTLSTAQAATHPCQAAACFSLNPRSSNRQSVENAVTMRNAAPGLQKQNHQYQQQDQASSRQTEQNLHANFPAQEQPLHHPVQQQQATLNHPSCAALPDLKSSTNIKPCRRWVSDVMVTIFEWLQPSNEAEGEMIAELHGWGDEGLQRFVDEHPLLERACRRNNAPLAKQILHQLFGVEL